LLISFSVSGQLVFLLAVTWGACSEDGGEPLQVRKISFRAKALEHPRRFVYLPSKTDCQLKRDASHWIFV
jgi:hypothetical protein